MNDRDVVWLLHLLFGVAMFTLAMLVIYVLAKNWH